MKNKVLKPILVIGAVLTLIIAWGLILFIIILGGDPNINSGLLELSFRQELNSYDLLDAPRRIRDGENPAIIEAHLSSLLEKAISVEEYLSVLKRRRVLAHIDRRYIDSYEHAARRALEEHPHSAPLAAIASDALLMNSFILNEEDRALLGNYAFNLSQSRFSLMELGLWILSGEMENAERASAIPWLGLLLAQDLSSLPFYIREDIAVNEFLLHAREGDTTGASFAINSLLSSVPDNEQVNSGIIRMAADFFYDHENFTRAAELFTGLDEDRDHSLAASALTLAGFGGAGNIWYSLAGSNDPAIRMRSHYNLASFAQDPGEAIMWLERLLVMPFSQDNIAGTYGIIRYLRLLDTERSLAILDDDNLRRSPLLDLEFLRLQMDSLPRRRVEAEIWLLLARHPQEDMLYEWALWYFDHQRLYGESALLFQAAARNYVEGSWMELHRALAHIVEGRLDEGERILLALLEHGSDWRAAANLGRIQESRRSIGSALVFYEMAASMVNDRIAAAQIQLRISRCLDALGRFQEGRRALQYALELDPDNLHIHREIRRDR